MKVVPRLRTCTFTEVRRVDRLVARRYDNFLAVSGLKSTQYSLLSHILESGPVRPADLARAANIDASTLTRNLKPLIEKGWLVRDAGPDARSHLISITKFGRATREAAKEQWRLAQSSINELLGDDRVAALNQLLDDCVTAL